MAIKNLPSRFVKTVPTQEQINIDNSDTENYLYHLMQSFNILRDREKCFQTDAKNHPEDTLANAVLQDTKVQLMQLAEIIDYAMSGVVEEEVIAEVLSLKKTLQELNEQREDIKEKLANFM